MLYASNRLLAARSLKEQFFNVLDSKGSDSARILLSRWIMAAQNSDLIKFVDCGNTMVRRSVGILDLSRVRRRKSIFPVCTNTAKIQYSCDSSSIPMVEIASHILTFLS